MERSGQPEERRGSTITTTVETKTTRASTAPTAGSRPASIRSRSAAAGYVLDGPNAKSVWDRGGPGAPKAISSYNRTRNLAAAALQWRVARQRSSQDKQKNSPPAARAATAAAHFSGPHDVRGMEAVLNRMGQPKLSWAAATRRNTPGSGHRTPTTAERPRCPPRRRSGRRVPLQLTANPGRRNERAQDAAERPKGAAPRCDRHEYDRAQKRRCARRGGRCRRQGWLPGFGSQFMASRSKTGKVTDFALPVLREEQPKARVDLELDPDRKHLGFARYDRPAVRPDGRKVQGDEGLSVSKEAIPQQRPSMVSPTSSTSDGKVKAKNQETRRALPARREDWPIRGKAGISKDPRASRNQRLCMPVDRQQQSLPDGIQLGHPHRPARRTDRAGHHCSPTPGSRPRRGQSTSRKPDVVG